MTASELTQVIIVAYLGGLAIVIIYLAGYIFFTRKKVKPKTMPVLWRVK